MAGEEKKKNYLKVCVNTWNSLVVLNELLLHLYFLTSYLRFHFKLNSRFSIELLAEHFKLIEVEQFWGN